jgi:hypothetical protein
MSVEPRSDDFPVPDEAAAPLTGSLGRTEGLWLGLILAVLAALPVMVASMPQMGDYSAHLARYHVMLDGGHSPYLAQYYTFQWKWTGNLGVDLLIQPLASIFGLETAGRLICMAIPLLTGLGILAVEWQLRRRIGVGALLAMAFIWSPALLMGFVNFGLSLALALFAFALWVRLEGKPWRWVPFVPIGMAVWLCHVSGWGILGVMVFGYEWSRQKSWRAFVAPWPLLGPLVPLLFSGGAKGLVTYGNYFWIYKWAIWKRAMRDQVYWLDMVTPVLVALAFIAAIALRKIDGRLGWTAVLLAVATLAVPRHIFGGDYADYRLVATCLLIACLAIDWSPSRRVLLYAASALFLTRIVFTTAGWYGTSREMEQILTTLDHVPQGARVANAVAIGRGEWPNNPFDHLGGYAVVRRDALTNANFAIPTIHMLSLKHGDANFNDPTQRVNYVPGQKIDLRAFGPAKQADYLWYIGPIEPAELPAGSEVIYRTEGSLLARLPARLPQAARVANGQRRG